MRLLIIEDEKVFRDSMQNYLMKIGFAVDSVGTLEAADELLFINVYDLILLDVNLPDGNGFTFCQKIRLSTNYIPVIMITARNEINDRISGLDTGADDYLVKPINYEELRARIHAVLRRAQNKMFEDMKVGDIKIIPNEFRVMINEEPVEFYMKEYEILFYLLITHPVPQTIEKIIEHVWDESVNPFSNAPRVHITNIRKKIKLHSKNVTLKNKSKVGYYLCIH